MKSRIAKLNQIFKSPSNGDGSGNHEPTNGAAIAHSTSAPVLLCLADVEARPIDWLWAGRIPLGRISLLVGRPGAGKSFLCCDLSSRITTGVPWPDGCGKAPLGDVLIISAEDDPHDTTRPRLDGCGADVDRVHLLTAIAWTDNEGNPAERMFTLHDILNLEKALRQLPSCKLVIIDPIGSYIGGKIDANQDNEVRAVLAPVARLAEQYSVAVLIVAHRRKAGGDTADDTALGSRAFTGIARAVWHLSRDPNNKARRLLLAGKQNLSEEPDGMAFTICGNPPAVQWESDPVQMNADDALADERSPGPEPEKREAAAAWLRELLAGREIEANEVQRQAKEAGLAWRTVRRASGEIGIIKEKNAYTGKSQWRLPKSGKQLGQVGGQHEISGQLGQVGQPTGKTE
jgi:putative DNA primase/helicase